jgi:hypothetical protein
VSALAPMEALQAALFALLTADEDLAAMVTGVFDHVPEGQGYPYVVLGEWIETPANRHDGFGRDSVLMLHVWSQYRGFGEAYRVGARVMALLDQQPLTVQGLEHVSTRYEMGQTMTDPEPPGDIRHLVQRYRFTTEQAGR